MSFDSHSYFIYKATKPEEKNLWCHVSTVVALSGWLGKELEGDEFMGTLS